MTVIGCDLTKYPFPVIIIAGVGGELPTRERGGSSSTTHSAKEAMMRVHVRKKREGRRDVIIEPSRRRHLPPLALRGLTKQTLKSEVEQAVEAFYRYDDGVGPQQ